MKKTSYNHRKLVFKICYHPLSSPEKQINEHNNNTTTTNNNNNNTYFHNQKNTSHLNRIICDTDVNNTLLNLHNPLPQQNENIRMM